jgi:hypothetical protein
MEYYSPIVKNVDQAVRAIQLLDTNPFVIVNQNGVYNQAEDTYLACIKRAAL